MNSTFALTAIDHFVLTVRDVEKSVAFYKDVLGCPVIRFAQNRFAVQIGNSKINFHETTCPVKPHSLNPTAGSADFCLLTETDISDVCRQLRSKGIAIEVGPVKRVGAVCPITSIYLRDPDGNLIEIANRA